MAHNGIDGVLVDGSKSFTSTVGNTITANSITANGRRGIYNFHGGNAQLTPPTIDSVALNVVSGKAQSGQRVELFADENDEGLVYLGADTADAWDNFSVLLPVPLPALPNFTATATDSAGNTSEFSAPFNVTAVEEKPESQIPKTFTLSENYPNPFNPETVIRYDLPKKTHVRLRVFNLLGQEVKTLVDEPQNSASYSVPWDGTDERGLGMASGIYLYRLEAGEFLAVKKMGLLR